jgi:hypothetical protein
VPGALLHWLLPARQLSVAGSQHTTYNLYTTKALMVTSIQLLYYACTATKLWRLTAHPTVPSWHNQHLAKQRLTKHIDPAAAVTAAASRPPLHLQMTASLPSAFWQASHQLAAAAAAAALLLLRWVQQALYLGQC